MNDDLRSIEVTIEQCEEQIALLEALERLEGNDDFIFVITNNLLREEAIRAVKAEADENLDPKGKKGMKNVRICIGQLESYFRKIRIFGNASKRAIAEDKLTREEILKEQMGDSVIELGSLQ